MASLMPSLPNLDLTDFERVRLAPGDRGWWASVPAVPGWYAIETNAPFAALDVLVPGVEKIKHYDFSKRAAATALLREYDEIIRPSSEGQSYIVYSGEAVHLQNRARQHTHGNTGTACLGLSAYPTLYEFKWEFLFRRCDDHLPGADGNKLIRTVLEQRWRAQHGWPLLCIS